MMTKDPHKELRNKLTELRENMVDTGFGIVPKSISLLLKMLDSPKDSNEIADIYFYLDAELIRWGNIALRVQFLQSFCQKFPNDPLSYATLSHALAELFLADPEQNQESKKDALDAGLRSLDIAHRENRFIRYCGSSLARLAISLNDYDVLHRALKYLVSSEAANCENDIPKFECDYISNIDSSRVDNELLNKYKNICESSLRS